MDLMLETGPKICNQDMVNGNKKITGFILVNSNMEKDTKKDHKLGQTVPHIQAAGQKVKKQDMGYKNGQMVRHLKDFG